MWVASLRSPSAHRSRSTDVAAGGWRPMNQSTPIIALLVNFTLSKSCCLCPAPHPSKCSPSMDYRARSLHKIDIELGYKSTLLHVNAQVRGKQYIITGAVAPNFATRHSVCQSVGLFHQKADSWTGLIDCRHRWAEKWILLNVKKHLESSFMATLMCFVFAHSSGRWQIDSEFPVNFSVSF